MPRFVAPARGSASPCTRPDPPRFRPALELLEERVVLSPYTLTTGTGDGTVTVGVDGFGAFGHRVGSDATDAFFDPAGGQARGRTTRQSGILIRFNFTNGSDRSVISSGDFATNGATPNRTNPTVTGTSTTANSTFSFGVLDFDLTQTLAPKILGVTQVGAVLTQVYTITNTAGSSRQFELVRFVQSQLIFISGDTTNSYDGGGHINGTPDYLFLTDVAGNPSFSTPYLGFNATGGTVPGSNRWFVENGATVRGLLEDGYFLNNASFADGGDADTFVDAGQERPVGGALRNLFTLAAGASVVYTTETIFGSGRPVNAADPGVNFLQSGGSTDAAEGGATDSYGVVLNTQPTANVIVTVTPDSQWSVAPTTLTFRPSNWNVPQTVTTTAFDDNIAEGAHTGTIAHSASSSDTAYAGLTLATITGTIADNDIPGVTLVQSSGFTASTEGGATDVYTIVLDTQPRNDVRITVAPDSQVAGTPTPLTFTAADWSIPQTVTVTAVDDAIAELSPHTGVLTHSVVSSDSFYQGIGVVAVTASITDNDPPGVIITASGGATSLAEASGSDDYTVSLVSPPVANVVVTLDPGTQLSVVPTTLTFTPATWNLPQPVTVSAVDDLLVEGNHVGVVAHSAASTDPLYNGLAIAGLTANIVDNDVAGVRIVESAGSTDVTEGGANDVYSVFLATPPTANVIVTVLPGPLVMTGPSTFTFTPGNWNLAQTVTVTAIDDLIAEGSPHDSVITHSATSGDTDYNGLAIVSVTAHITDNEVVGVTITPSGGTTNVSEGGSGDSYTVVLTSQPTADVVVAVNAPGQISVSPPALVFTAVSWNVAQTVSVSAIDDSIAEGLTTATLTHTVTSLDASYDGFAANSLDVDINDNETLGITVGGGSIDVSEDGGNDSFTVVLTSQPLADVIVTVAPNAQATVAPSVLTFTALDWNVARTVTVAAVDDPFSETNPHPGVMTLTATSGDPGYNAFPLAPLTANVADNDQPGLIVTPNASPLELLEGGVAQGYTVRLRTPPTADVVVTMTPEADVATNLATLTFTPANWNIPRPVALSGADDSAVEGPHRGVVSHSTSSGDPAYNGIAPVDLTARIFDNDGEFIVGTTRADQIVVAPAPDGTNIVVTLNGKATTLFGGAVQLLIQAGDGNDSISITDPSLPVVVVGGRGTDRLFVNGRRVSNTFEQDGGATFVNGTAVSVWEVEGVVVDGSAGNDLFVVTNLPAFSTEFKGEAGSDRVVGPDRANLWKVTGVDVGMLGTTIKLNGVENWTGGNQADNFVFSAGKRLTGQVDGGGGSDVLDLAAYTSAITVNLQTTSSTAVGALANFEMFRGGRGSDRLIGADASNLWSVTSLNAGAVGGVLFQGFENLTGGAFDDVFQFSDNQGIKGKIDGAAGLDTLDYSAYLSRPVVVNLQAKSATTTGGIANLEAFLGGGGPSDTLVAANLVNAWLFVAGGTGTLNGLDFAEFENFTGGSLADSFTMSAGGTWLGLLNGAGGSNTLSAFAGAVNVWTNTSINAGTLNGRRFSGIQFRR